MSQTAMPLIFGMPSLGMPSAPLTRTRRVATVLIRLTASCAGAVLMPCV